MVDGLVWNERVAGSSPVTLTKCSLCFIGVLASGMSLGLGPRSREFDSLHSDQFSNGAVAQLGSALFWQDRLCGFNSHQLHQF